MPSPYMLKARNGRCYWRINREHDADAQVQAERHAEQFASDLRSTVSVFNSLGWHLTDVRPGEGCRLLEVCEIEAYNARSEAERLERES